MDQLIQRPTSESGRDSPSLFCSSAAEDPPLRFFGPYATADATGAIFCAHQPGFLNCCPFRAVACPLLGTVRLHLIPSLLLFPSFLPSFLPSFPSFVPFFPSLLSFFCVWFRHNTDEAVQELELQALRLCQVLNILRNMTVAQVCPTPPLFFSFLWLSAVLLLHAYLHSSLLGCFKDNETVATHPLVVSLIARW